MAIDLEKNPADMALIRNAALGDLSALEELRSRKVLFAQSEGLCFTVSTVDESGRQQGILSEHREGGGGMDSLIEIPSSFTIVDVAMEGSKVVLTAEDGRVLAAEPERFGFRHLIREANNPDYEAQLEHDFLSIPTKRRGEAGLYRDEWENEWTYNTEIGGYWLTRSVGGEKAQAEVSCEATTRDELIEMLPTVNQRLQRLDAYVNAAKAYLWKSGSEEEREVLGLEEFQALLRLDSVNFSYYGDLELWLGEKDEDGALFDGYSPTIYFDRKDEIVNWAMNG
ncbi:hypothetical protein [Saccharibacillus sacchari]|uniref:Uncharacterized protein n=1 Tax=Saccharibacillus sacchari TaxID=456493 RepID=A0ACC6PCC0_9BACL